MPRWRRWLRWAFAWGCLALLAWPPVGVDCEEPYLREASPDGANAIVVCRRPVFFAMPGQSGDAPGWISIRDRRDYVAGVVDLSGINMIDMPTRWTEDGVALPLLAEFARPAEMAAPLAWLRDRGWKWRALLGFVAPDAAFR